MLTARQRARRSTRAHALHMMPLALPSSTQVWKEGRYESTRSCCGTKTSMLWRVEPLVASSSFATKCLQHALACSGYDTSLACSKPWMKLAAYWPLRKGSSPADSMLRPQRGSAKRKRGAHASSNHAQGDARAAPHAARATHRARC